MIGPVGEPPDTATYRTLIQVEAPHGGQVVSGVPSPFAWAGAVGLARPVDRGPIAGPAEKLG
ncbi:hypothetical protein GCM10010304_01980 [Streptomyces roseoviolaceus]